ncbi:MAG TPA: polyribonucleotide nucleotidyltransferase, partial [Thermomicrobiales bacterium]|nr:polyribonucleotide nucleotidyltransferase [Thermomicrobiales bacterium]
MILDNSPTIHTVELDIAGRALSLETGRIAGQADGAVVVRYGDTTVLSTVVGESEPREDVPFFPLTVDYEERMYAAGKIPGGFIKREGRPTEAAILAARLTDRPIRPLFPKGYRAEVQVITTVMSADQENDPDILSIVGASAALMLSPIPWDGPVGAVRVGYVDGKIVINPTTSTLESSKLDMVIAGTADAIMMVEGDAAVVPEAVLLDAIAAAHEVIRDICRIQNELRTLAGKEKWPFQPPQRDEALFAHVREALGDRLRQAVNNPDKVVRLEGTSELKHELIATLEAQEQAGEGGNYSPQEIGDAFEALLKDEVRGSILRDGVRPDGRRPDEIRPIWCEVGYLPRTHGSAIF